MPMTCNCPKCGALLTLPEEHLGNRVICPKCQAEFSADEPPMQSMPPSLGAIQTDSDSERDPPWRREAGGDDSNLTESPVRRRPFEDLEDEDYTRRRFPEGGVPGGGNAVAVIVLLSVSMIVDAAGLGVDALEYGLIDDTIHGKQPPQAQAALYDRLETMTGIVEFLLYVVTAVMFCIWTYRAYKNLQLLRVRGLKHSPGWAIGYFFIPILSLYKPCVVFLEMWKASDPYAPLDDPYSWNARSGGALVGLWWTFWIISNLIGNVSGRMGHISVQANLQELKMQVILSGLGHAVSIPAAILAILVVKGIQNRQVEKHLRLLETESLYFADRTRDER